jgi:AAA domain/Bifunctional DNA primase/polymerase, N-terminal
MMAYPPDDAHGGSLTPGNDPFGTPLDAARALTAEKVVIFPADHPDAGLACTGAARECREGVCAAAKDAKARGKHPRVARWDLLTADDVPTLDEWFDGPIPVNLAVSCGPSGLLIVDDDVDGGLLAYAEHMGVSVPATFTVRTHQGHHYYFRQPAGRAPLGNRPGWLRDFGCDIRGAGGYVIGPGSTHWSGDRYAPEDDCAPVEAPEWLIEAIESEGTGPPAADGGGADARGKAGESGTTLPTSGLARWDSAPRYGSPAKLRDQYRRHCREVRTQGGEYRWELFLAARDGWRLVNLDLLTEDALRADMARVIARVWSGTEGYDPDDPRDWKIIDSEARVTGPASAARSPWELASVGGGREFRSQLPDGVIPLPTRQDAAEPMAESRTTDGNRSVEPLTEGDDVDSGLSMADEEFAERVTERLQWLDVDAEARRIRAARDLVPVEGTDAVAFFSGPPPEYLVPGMVHRDGIAILFGAPHCGKSFLALDIALSFASGKPWAGGDGAAIALADGSPGVVHYVMAEAEGTNIGRGNAWFKHHQIGPVDVQGRFIPVTTPFRLTEAEVPLYLPAVERDRPNLIVFDTKNAMYGGKESQGDDIAEMVRALRLIREAAGRCALLVIDHTGLNDPSRPRGSNAWEGASDSMIIAVKDKDTGHHKITTIRDRNAPEDSPTWGFRREPVMVGGRNEAVLVPIDVTEHAPFVVPTWADVELPDFIREPINGAKNPAGKAHPGRREALWIMLIMRAAADREEGHTQADLRSIIGQHVGKPEKAFRGLVSDAVTMLKRLGMVEGIARGRIILTDRYVPKAD